MRSPVMLFVFRTGMIVFALLSIILVSGLAEGGISFLPGLALLALCCTFTWALFQISMPPAPEARASHRTNNKPQPRPPMVISHPTKGRVA